MSQTVLYFPTRPVRRPVVAAAPSVWQRVVAWLVAAQTRQQLASLDDRALRDIGLTRTMTQQPILELDPRSYR